MSSPTTIVFVSLTVTAQVAPPWSTPCPQSRFSLYERKQKQIVFAELIEMHAAPCEL
jgi:hypothetical protein